MQLPWFSGIVLPVLLSVAVAAWKAFTRRTGWQDEDGALGFDLLFAAIASQLAFFPLARYEEQLRVGWTLLRYIVALTAFSGLGIWAGGYVLNEFNEVVQRRWVMVAHNVLGVIALSGVLLGNVYWMITLERLPDWMML
jgi:hypothetical protein